MALSTYRTELRRLLRDANGRFWSNDELNDYINQSRKQVATDTHCLRSVEDVAFTNGDETYAWASFTSLGVRAVDMLNLTVIWGQQRVPMMWAPWTEFNARYRVWVTNESRPCVWSMTGSLPSATIYVQPVPDDDYDGEADVAYIPVDLVDDTTVDEIVYPFTKPVAYYAAHLAKFKEQSYGESQIFIAQYARLAMECINTYTRKLPNVYSSGGMR